MPRWEPSDRKIVTKWSVWASLRSSIGTPAALTSEAPFNAAGPNDAQDLLTKVSFQGWGPRHETEPQSVVDHCEPTRGQVKALPIDAGDNISILNGVVRQATA